MHEPASKKLSAPEPSNACLRGAGGWGWGVGVGQRLVGTRWLGRGRVAARSARVQRSAPRPPSTPPPDKHWPEEVGQDGGGGGGVGPKDGIHVGRQVGVGARRGGQRVDGKANRVEDLGHLAVLGDEQQAVGHIVVPHVHDRRPYPRPQAGLDAGDEAVHCARRAWRGLHALQALAGVGQAVGRAVRQQVVLHQAPQAEHVVRDLAGGLCEGRGRGAEGAAEAFPRHHSDASRAARPLHTPIKTPGATTNAPCLFSTPSPLSPLPHDLASRHRARDWRT